MKKKCKIPFSKRWKHNLSERAPLFFFLALSATIVVVAFVWQNSAGQRISFRETADDWRVRQVLPAGAETASGGLVQLDGGKQVAGYTLDGRSYLALLNTDSSGRLELANTLDLNRFDATISGVPTVSTKAIGSGASPAIVAKAAAGSQTAATLLARLDGRKLVPMVRVDGGGDNYIAIFYDGQVSDGRESFSLEDVDGDDRLDAVVRGQYYHMGDGTAVTNESADVYVWDGQFWQYDKRLSWALTARNGLFPEPPQYPAGE